MKAIMLSVNPPHAGNLVDGLKRVEWRIKPFPVPCIAFIYETKRNGGCGKVIGEVVFEKSRRFDTNKISFSDLGTIVFGMVFIADLKRYAEKNKGILYANKSENAKRYDKPKELSEFARFQEKHCKERDCTNCNKHYVPIGYCEKVKIHRPPQSWCYVEAK